MLTILLTESWNSGNSLHASHIIFDVNSPELEVRKVDAPNASGEGSHGQTKRGKTQFVLKGNVSSGRVWFIPIKTRVSSAFEIQFQISSTNIRTFKRSSNLVLVVQTTSNSNSNKTQKLKIFESVGPKDSAVGRIPVQNPNGGIIIEGLFIDIALRERGQGQLLISSLTITVEGNIKGKKEVERALAIPPPTTAQVIQSSWDVSTLSVNGTHHFGIGLGPNLSPENHFNHGTSKQNFPLIKKALINFGGPSPYFPKSLPVWQYPDYIDYFQIDKVLNQSVLHDEHFILLEVLLQTPPKWWVDQQRGFREEKFRANAAEKRTKGPFSNSNIEYTETKRTEDDQKQILSDQNPRWREYCQDALKHLLSHVREKTYASRIIGCTVILGAGLNNFPYPNRDLNSAYIEEFQNWLRRKYPRISKLRSAWKSNEIHYNTAFPVPSEKWHTGDVFSFVHPQKTSRGLDSYLYYQESWAKNLVKFCKYIKTLTHQRYITGVVGGPGLMFNHLWNNNYQTSSEAIRTVLESEEVDYIDIPLDASDLRCGYGTNGLETILSDELKQRKKLLLVGNPLAFHPLHGGTDETVTDLKETIEVQRRIFVSCLVNNVYLYYFPTHDTQFKNTIFESETAKYHRICKNSLNLDRQKSSEVAFVIDFELFKHLAPDRNQAIVDINQAGTSNQSVFSLPYLSSKASNYFYLVTVPRLTWNRIGVPFDVVDIERLNPQAYKAFIFFHSLYLNDKRNEILDACKQQEKTLFSIWANGYITDQYLTAEGVENFTDMTVILRPKESSFTLSPTPTLNTYMNRPFNPPSLGWYYTFREPKRYSKIQFAPHFAINDSSATTLAVYPKSGEPALATKKFRDWTSFYSDSPIINPELLRSALKNGNVRVVLDTSDSCYINNAFIGIHTMTEGVRKLKLPEEGALFEVFRNQELDKKRVHKINLEGGTTYLFFRGDKKTWESLEK